MRDRRRFQRRAYETVNWCRINCETALKYVRQTISTNLEKVQHRNTYFASDENPPQYRQSRVVEAKIEPSNRWVRDRQHCSNERGVSDAEWSSLFWGNPTLFTACAAVRYKLEPSNTSSFLQKSVGRSLNDHQTVNWYFRASLNVTILHATVHTRD